MIPLPPPDPALPALPSLLDADLVAELSDLDIGRPTYIRYKRGTSCLVQYERAHAWIFADRRAAATWRRPAFRRHLERATRRHGLDRPAVLVAELGALLQVHPTDFWLPHLVRLKGELVRYKPGRKALVRRKGLYWKTHADAAERRWRVARAIWRAGVPTPEPVAFRADRQAVAYAEVPGTRLADADRTRHLEAVAEALEGLHWAQVDAPAGDEAPGVVAAARVVAGLVPALATTVEGLAQALVERLPLVERPVVVHGDFYDDQVLLTPHGAVLLDLDEVRLGDPRTDAANFRAHELVRGRETEFGEEAPELEAAALMRLAVGPFRRLEPEWPGEVERIVRLAEERLRLPQLRRCLALPGAQLVRHKPGRRAVIRFPARRLYGKTYASDRGPRVYALLREVARLRPCGEDVAVPEPVAYDEELGLVLVRELSGVPVTDRLTAALAEQIGRALRSLHESDLRPPKVHTLEDELAPLAPRAERLRALPELAGLVERVLDVLAAPPDAWQLRPAHRDFYDAQILVGGRGLAVLDWDDAALADPAVDVANFLAHLRLTAAAPEVASSFRAAYGDVDDVLVDLLEAATLLRLADIHLERIGVAGSRALLAEGAALVGRPPAALCG